MSDEANTTRRKEIIRLSLGSVLLLSKLNQTKSMTHFSIILSYAGCSDICCFHLLRQKPASALQHVCDNRKRTLDAP